MAKVLLRNIRSGKRKAALLDLESLARKQIEQTLDQKVKPALIKSHELIVANWSSDVGFQARKFITGDSISINVFPTGADKQIWIFVDQGTKPHTIRAKGGGRLKFQAGTYKPKTLANPARTASGGGTVSGGVTVFPKAVNHPGTQARNFSETIAEDIRPSFIQEMEAAFRLVAKAVEE